MKFLVALAVLPAILAAPAPAPVPDVPTGPGTSYETWACACVNDAGKTLAPSACAYAYAGGTELDGESYGPRNRADSFRSTHCYPLANWTIDRENPLTEEYCKATFPDTFNKSTCKTIKVCWNTGPYFKLC